MKPATTGSDGFHFMTDCSAWRFEKGGRSNGCDG